MKTDIKDMTLEELRTRIYAKIDELPTIPIVVVKVLELIEDEKSDSDDLTQVISKDPALTAKVLKAANSAYYGFSQEISSLNRAVALLGMNMVQSLALSIGVLDNLPQEKEDINFSSKGLWLHSLAVATGMTEILRHCDNRAEKDYLFTIGILHDVGKIALLHFFYEEYLEALESAVDGNGSTLYLSERKTIGFDHGQVGAMLLGRWKFPKEVILPIACHHNDPVPTKVDPYDIAILKVADALSRKAGIGQGEEKTHKEDLGSYLAVLGLDNEQLKHVYKHIVDSKQEIEAFFSSMS